LNRRESAGSALRDETRSASGTSEGQVADFWAYRRRREIRHTGHDIRDVHVSAIQGCITYLSGHVRSITAGTGPLLRLRFGLGLRRVGLERAIRTLSTGGDTEIHSAALLERIGRLSSLLSTVPGTDPADLRLLAEDLRALCDDVTDRLWTFLHSSAPDSAGSHDNASPATPD
jgi:hypothetical protein